jgi:hypothetical protein
LRADHETSTTSVRAGAKVALVLVSVGLISAGASFPPAGQRPRANLWVHPQQAGSCIRSPTPVAYNPKTACAGLGAAYAAANRSASRSLVLVRGGIYRRAQIAGNRVSRKRIIFQAARGEAPTFSGDYLRLGMIDRPAAGPDYVTIRGFVGATGASPQVPDNRHGIHITVGSSHIRLENVRAGNVVIHGSTDILVEDSELGPCRASMVIGAGSHGSGVPDTRYCEINKIDHFGAQPRRITFDNVVFHNYDYAASCFRVDQGGTNTLWPDCHWRSVLANGVDGLTIRNSTFREGAHAPAVAISGPAAAAVGNKNILIENNFFGTGVNYGSGMGRYDKRAYGRWEALDFSHCNVARPGVYAFDDVLYRFNSGSPRAGFSMLVAELGCARDKIRNVRVIGNIGLRNSCTTDVTYRYNVYSTAGRCHSTDRNIGASGVIPFYVSGTHSPRPRDYRLVGRRTLADNRVPARIGCPAADKFGNRRGAGGFCDAGAHER